MSALRLAYLPNSLGMTFRDSLDKKIGFPQYNYRLRRLSKLDFCLFSYNKILYPFFGKIGQEVMISDVKRMSVQYTVLSL